MSQQTETERVRNPNTIIRGLERLLESYTVRTQADHLLREPVETVQTVGFSVEYLKQTVSDVPYYKSSRADGRF